MSRSDLKKITEYWNQKENLHKIVSLSGARMAKLVLRLKDDVFADNWELLIDKTDASPFLTGDNNRHWVVSFDWLIANDNNYIKVLEGKYDARETGASPVKKTKLFPIKGRSCGHPGCHMPAVYKSSGNYDHYYCIDHSPLKVKEQYC